MKTQQLNNGKTEVYSTSGFKDTLASPVFYPVVVVAIVLGVTSMLGLVQNPLKLKSMVSVIHQKVSISNVVNDSYQDKRYSMATENHSASALSLIAATNDSIFPDSTEQSDVYSNLDRNITEKMTIDEPVERIAFNYDVTSESFWRDLDSSNIETASEEMNRKNKESMTIGAPLKIDHQENYPTELKTQDQTIYALSNANKI